MLGLALEDRCNCGSSACLSVWYSLLCCVLLLRGCLQRYSGVCCWCALVGAAVLPAYLPACVFDVCLACSLVAFFFFSSFRSSWSSRRQGNTVDRCKNVYRQRQTVRGSPTLESSVRENHMSGVLEFLFT